MTDAPWVGAQNRKNFYPIRLTVFLQEYIPRTVLPVEGSAFRRATLQRTERKLAGPGRPGSVDETGDRRWGAGRRSALRHWARAVQGCRARWVGNPASKGATSLRPGASRRSIALAHFARDWQTSDASRRENAEGWLFEIVDRKIKGEAPVSPRPALSRGEVGAKRRVRGQALRCQ